MCVWADKQLLNQEEDLIQVQHAVGKVTDFPVDMQAFCKYMKVLVLQRDNSAKLFSHNGAHPRPPTCQPHFMI